MTPTPLNPSAEHPIYFDNNATTAADPRVVQAMLPTFEINYGNPESPHAFGWRARVLVERARELTSRMIGAKTHEIEFTSGATESIQRAILGCLTQAGEPTVHIITAETEHKATLDACAEAQRRGHHVTILTTDNEGRISLAGLIKALKSNTRLVTLMHANNEIGTLHPIHEIGAILRQHAPDAWFHVDACQTAGKHEIDVDQMHIDLLSLSSHKFHGPKGIGALYKRSTPGRRIHLRELPHGTANVSAIVGLGAACEIAHIEGRRDFEKMRVQRDLIIDTLLANINFLSLNGPRHQRLCNNISLTFQQVEQDELALTLKGIAYSSASACTGTAHSHVLKAIGRTTDDPFETTVRFGLSKQTSDEEVSYLITQVIAGVKRTREISGGYDTVAAPLLKK